MTAGNRGFLAIGDWLACYRCDLIALFNPPKSRLPSYSTIRPVLLELDYAQYSASFARFFGIEPLPGETLAVDGKVLRGSYQLETDNADSPPHPAILLVSAYLVERGLILEPYQVDCKTNEIKLLKTVQVNFVPEVSYTEISKGHGRLEKRVISLCTTLDNINPWPGLKTLVRVESERQFQYGGHLRRGNGSLPPVKQPCLSDLS